MKECKSLTKKQIQLIRDQIGKNVLLSIGVNEYKNPKDNLRICVKDARDIYRIFVDNEKITFVDEMSVLLDSKQNTTLEEVLKQIDILCQTSQRDMNLILFYSGHGMSIDGEFHFILSDSEPSEKKNLISIGQVINMLEGSRFKNLLLLIDACQTIFEGGKNIGCESFANQKKYVSSSKGISIIYSCSVGEHSQENIFPIENSVFTSLLLEAFNGKKDALAGHYLSAMSLYSYVSFESQKKSSSYQQVNQTSQIVRSALKDAYQVFEMFYGEE